MDSVFQGDQGAAKFSCGSNAIIGGLLRKDRYGYIVEGTAGIGSISSIMYKRVSPAFNPCVISLKAGVQEVAKNCEWGTEVPRTMAGKKSTGGKLVRASKCKQGH